ncbi:unnamed protein product [Urochloa humidicola]
MDHRWLPGAWGEHPAHVHAGVARTDAIRAAEWELEIFTLFAVQVDARVRLDTAEVKHAAARQFCVPPQELGVTRCSAASFLIRFDTQQQRNAAYQFKELRLDHTTLHIMSWKRQVSSKALSKFHYRARLCIEGVPSHARHAEAVACLFKAPSFIEDTDCPMEKPEEEECLRLWLWTADPDGIATTGTLHIEEPVTLPEGYDGSMFGQDELMSASRHESAKALDYDVIIHVDRVFDYSVPPASPTHTEWPVRHPFRWRLGVPDGEVQPEAVRRRISVYDRLGDRGGRDRSPPRGGAGSSGNLGFRHMPPAGPFDVPHNHGGGSSHHASSSRQHGGQYRRNVLQWKIKGAGSSLARPSVFERLGSEKAGQSGSSNGLDPSIPVDSFLFDENWIPMQRTEDPMLEEAERQPTKGRCLPNVPRCSVEPPAADGALAATGFISSAMAAEAQHELRTETILLAVHDGDAPTASVQDQPEHAEAVHETSVLVADTSESSQAEPLLEQAMQLDNFETQATTVGKCISENDGPPISNMGSLLDGLPFDLNQELTVLQNDAESQPAEHRDRALMDATERQLNREAPQGSFHKSAPRTVTRFAVPLKRSLLCNPMLRSKSQSTKKQTQVECAVEKKKSSKSVARNSNMSIDEQATVILMKATGVIDETAKLTEEAQQKFGEQFVDPLQDEPVCDIRIALGIPGKGHADVLGVLVREAGTDDV